MICCNLCGQDKKREEERGVGRSIRALAAALLLLFLLAGQAWAEDTDVSSMDIDCQVENDGACTVTMRFTADFAPGTQDFEIPIDPAARDVSCTGAAYELGRAEGWRVVRLTGSHSGPTNVTVSYRLAETVTDDGKKQSFSLGLLWPGWTCPISNYQVTVTLHRAFDSMPLFLSGYYGDLIDNYMDISIEEGVIHAKLNPKQTLQDHEAMSMSLELPEGFFDLRFLAGKTAGVDRLLFFGLLLLTLLYWGVFLRNLPILPKRQAMAPEGGNAGEVPFLLTDRDPDLALMVVQWAALGYLIVHRTRKGRVYLTRQMEMDTERKGFEVEIFHCLFARSDRCDVRSAEYLKARRLCVEKTRSFWQNRVFDPKAGKPLFLRLLALGAGTVLCLACFDVWVASKSWRWLVIVPLTLLGGGACWCLQQMGGFLLRRHSLRTALLALAAALALSLAGRAGGFGGLMLLNLLLQLTVGLLLRCGGRRTRSGAALAAELLGYRRYLLSASTELVQSNLQADPQYFYRALPYADALRVGRIFSAAFDRARLEDCGWLDWEGKPIKTAPGFYARYCRLMAGLRGERDPAGGPRSAQGRSRPVSTRVNPRPRSGAARRPASRGGTRP